MTRRAVSSIVIATAFAGALLAAAACVRLGLRHGDEPAPGAVKRTPVTGLGPAKLALGTLPRGTRRLLLDPPALVRLREAAKSGTVPYRFALARANEALEKPLASGYQGFEWADAVAHLALVWHATGDERYAAAGLRYLGSLLDDRLEPGDGKGGDGVVRHDSGYGIRTFGAYTALGYDWLRDAPGFEPALRERVIARLGAWLDWYRRDGYLRDRASANYYWGYLTALSFAGLALSGESARGDEWLALARDELAERALPLLRDDLRGGGWPEGAQYGEYTTMEIALVAEAFRTGASIDVTRQIPWLSDTVTFHTHALLPDERTVYDGGTWGEHPAKPSALGVAAASIALESIGDARAAEARWLLRHALPPLRREQAWVGALADRPGAPERSPRGTATSLHVKGQGLTLARSDWSKQATFVSFQSGPRLAEDHQDADQGHFELFRGSDGLLVDGGDSEGSATVNHNTLLVDDGGRHLNYAPNQGVFGADRVKTTRFDDDGSVLVAVGDFGEAYAPACARQGCKDRSVTRLTRSFVFVRPSLLVVSDDVVLERSSYGVTWAAHLTRAPVLNGDLASAVVGESRVDVRTLEPREARRSAPREPTPSGEGSHRANKPWGPMWRLEIESPRTERERRFLHVVSAGRADAPAPEARVLTSEGATGARIDGEGRRTVVLFARGAAPASVALGGPADAVIVAGLEPGRSYVIALEPSCSLRLTEGKGAGAQRVGAGGFLRVAARDCGPN
jgi:hypothetical protein